MPGNAPGPSLATPTYLLGSRVPRTPTHTASVATTATLVTGRTLVAIRRVCTHNVSLLRARGLSAGNGTGSCPASRPTTATRPCATSKPTPTGCATPTSATSACSSAPEQSKQAAKPSSDNDSDSPGCAGASPAQPASPPCAANTPAAAGRDLATTPQPDNRRLTLPPPEDDLPTYKSVAHPAGWMGRGGPVLSVLAPTLEESGAETGEG